MSEENNHGMDFLDHAGSLEFHSGNKPQSLEFPNAEISLEKPLEFAINLEKRPLDIKDGDYLGANATEVKFEGRLAELMVKASELKELPENDRIFKLVEMVRSNLIYPYPEAVEQISQKDPNLGEWLTNRFGAKTKISQGVNLNDCLDRGYGNCKIMASAFLVLAQSADLKGIFAQNGQDKLINLIRPDNGEAIFKMGEVGKVVDFSHAWAEVQLKDGSWVPVDLTANMVGSTPEMLEVFKQANYKIQVPVNFEGMPYGLDREPPAVKFEPGQKGGSFNMGIKIQKRIAMSATGSEEIPNIEKYVGPINLSLADSNDYKSSNLNIV